MYVEDDFYVVSSCHKKFGHICELLGEETLMGDILGEPHNLSGSLRRTERSLWQPWKIMLTSLPFWQDVVGKILVERWKDKPLWGSA